MFLCNWNDVKMTRPPARAFTQNSHNGMSLNAIRHFLDTSNRCLGQNLTNTEVFLCNWNGVYNNITILLVINDVRQMFRTFQMGNTCKKANQGWYSITRKILNCFLPFLHSVPTVQYTHSWNKLNQFSIIG